MPVTVQTIGINRSLAKIKEIINQTENGPFKLVSLAAGTVAGSAANVVGFSSVPLDRKAELSSFRQWPEISPCNSRRINSTRATRK
jgi:hypothetical protein